MDGVGWKARGDRKTKFNNARSFMPRIKHSAKLIMLCIRYTGVPIGGIGCGSIGTDHRMAFNRFSIIPGIKEQTTNIKSNIFIVSVHSKLTGSLIYQSLLSAADFNGKALKSWKTMRPENVKYRGLFPRAWYEFTLGETGIKILCTQVSPVVPNNYEDTSLPVADFEFEVVNEAEEDVNVSIVFTFRNGTGNAKWNSESICEVQEFCEAEKYTGISLKHKVRGMDLTYVLGNNGKDVMTTSFDPNSNGNEIWKELERSGDLPEKIESKNERRELGIAIRTKILVEKSGSNSTIFSLTWFMPKVDFGKNCGRSYERRYTRFFTNPFDISKHAIQQFATWQTHIDAWQNPIIHDESLPDWYRSALFNELYYSVDGSTIWFNYEDAWRIQEPRISPETERHFREFGRFGYMESWEYYMINTYDVHYYSSWAFLKNWPMIELGIQLDFADQVSRVDASQTTSLFEGHPMQVKKPARIPHDMGHPITNPWISTNAYILHDTSDWKDLNLKFVISSWRDFKLIVRQSKFHDNSEAQRILRLFYEKSKEIVDRALEDWDVDNDGMIENSGFADQTYDAWKMTGTSSYCGSLWIAALTCLIEMSKNLEKNENCEKYQQLAEKSNRIFIEKLWNGKFFRFDEDKNNEDVIMADQLSGFWALLINDDEVCMDREKILSAIRVVFENNVKKYGDGEFGAVNGFLTTGSVDSSSIQSMEVWSGITYALSSLMIELDMKNEAFETSEGLFKSIWHNYPLQFQTPEAFAEDGMYRALGYMRPMSIWSIQHSIDKKRSN
ncbi:unnamed protein product [Caenorhabditis angaria]|uniref:Non-lysosomal glucosylceramidase n=1 Tax=Caenorhabditis angaria TaxID=860376 RepID=A0A9P1IZ65_9PELO|nr:unnamed protein product [Caenorhabditis angaria]